MLQLRHTEQIYPKGPEICLLPALLQAHQHPMITSNIICPIFTLRANIVIDFRSLIFCVYTMNKGKPANVGIDSPKKPQKRYSTLYQNNNTQMRHLQGSPEFGLGDHGYLKQSIYLTGREYGKHNCTDCPVHGTSGPIKRVIEKLNTLQDPREQYFNLKMQKLMA